MTTNDIQSPTDQRKPADNDVMAKAMDAWWRDLSRRGDPLRQTDNFKSFSPRDSLERRANSAANRWLKRQPIEIQEEFDGPVK